MELYERRPLRCGYDGHSIPLALVVQRALNVCAGGIRALVEKDHGWLVEVDAPHSDSLLLAQRQPVFPAATFGSPAPLALDEVVQLECAHDTLQLRVKIFE